MKRIFAYPLTLLFYITFFTALVLFQPIQFVAWHLFGAEAQKKVVDVLNFFLMKLVFVLGIKMVYVGKCDFPTDRPLIIISNHQGTYDIPPIIWLFRKHHPKFVAKKELGKNIPSISYNLRKSGAALIDRSSRSQAVREIFKLGKLIAEKNYAACIFPEGTRSRNGKLRRFKSAGLETLLRAAPNALIVPFVVDGNYKIEQNGAFPLNIMQKVTFTILDAIEPAERSAEEIIQQAENLIKQQLGETV